MSRADAERRLIGQETSAARNPKFHHISPITIIIKLITRVLAIVNISNNSSINSYIKTVINRPRRQIILKPCSIAYFLSGFTAQVVDGFMGVVSGFSKGFIYAVKPVSLNWFLISKEHKRGQRQIYLAGWYWKAGFMVSISGFIFMAGPAAVYYRGPNNYQYYSGGSLL